MLGIAAIAIAVFSVAFKTAVNKPVNSFFEFDYDSYSPTINNVQDESKWIQVSGLGTCSNNDVKACRIEVASTYVSGTSLLSTAALVAQESSTNIAYVKSGNTVNIKNKN